MNTITGFIVLKLTEVPLPCHRRSRAYAEKIEDFCGVSIMITDYEDACEVSLLALPYACILGAFIIEMLDRAYYSIMDSLVQHGW